MFEYLYLPSGKFYRKSQKEAQQCDHISSIRAEQNNAKHLSRKLEYDELPMKVIAQQSTSLKGRLEVLRFFYISKKATINYYVKKV